MQGKKWKRGCKTVIVRRKKKVDRTYTDNWLTSSRIQVVMLLMPFVSSVKFSIVKQISTTQKRKRRHALLPAKQVSTRVNQPRHPQIFGGGGRTVHRNRHFFCTKKRLERRQAYRAASVYGKQSKSKKEMWNSTKSLALSLIGSGEEGEKKSSDLVGPA